MFDRLHMAGALVEFSAATQSGHMSISLLFTIVRFQLYGERLLPDVQGGILRGGCVSGVARQV